MQTRAAAAAESQPSVPPGLPLFTVAELDAQHGDPEKLINLFVSLHLLQPVNRPCSVCAAQGKSGHMRLQHKQNHADGLNLRRTTCKYEESHRRNSTFESLRISTLETGRLLCYFWADLTVTQACELSSVSINTVSDLYDKIRDQMAEYIDANPVKFDDDDIVEIDEIYLKPLRPNGDETDEKAVWKPIIGCIGRKSGCVALDICDSHQTRDIQENIKSHFRSGDTPVITDQHKSFRFLDRTFLHSWCKKVHIGTNVYPKHARSETRYGRTYQVHTNTIEGYWSKLRLKLHASHGWEAGCLPKILNECQFRSLGISLTTVLRV